MQQESVKPLHGNGLLVHSNIILLAIITILNVYMYNFS